MAFNFEEWIGQHGILGQVGFYNVVLPFLLLFVILYGILMMIGLFGKEARGKKINAVVSLILALFITYSTGYLAWFASVVSNLTGFIGIILLGLLFFFMLYSFVTGNNAQTMLGSGKYLKWILLVAVAIIVYLLFSQSGGLSRFGLGNIEGIHIPISVQSIIMFIIVGGLIFLVIWAVFGDNWFKKSGQGNQNKGQ